MKSFLLCVSFLFIGLFCVAQGDAFLTKLKSTSVEQLNTIKIPDLTIKQYTDLTDYAISLFSDILNKNNKLKGEVILSVAADSLTHKVAVKAIDYYDPAVTALVNKYKKYQYLILPPKPSDFTKLANYACEGDYGYIYSRMSVTRWFIPAVVIIPLIIIFSIINLTGIMKWKFRRKYNISVLFIIILLIIVTVVFKTTCSKYVTERSFYGFHF